MYSYIFKKKHFRFLVIGIFNTFLAYSLFSLLVWFGIHFSVAALATNILGLFVRFKTFGMFVFNSKKNILLVKFILVYALMYGINISFLNLMIGMGFLPYVAQAIFIPVYIILIYFLLENFVFRNAKQKAPHSEE